MDPALLYEPRPIAVEYMCNWKSADQDMLRTEFQEVGTLQSPSMIDPDLARIVCYTGILFITTHNACIIPAPRIA